jgi:hypothetical protein
MREGAEAMQPGMSELNTARLLGPDALGMTPVLDLDPAGREAA